MLRWFRYKTILKLRTQLKEAENENAKLKAKLGFAHTKINDLRYAKKQRDEHIKRL